MDVFSVERGDEHPIEPGHHFMGDLIGLVFQALDGLRDGPAAHRFGLEQLF